VDIRFIGKQISVTEGIKQHLQDKLSRFEKYAPKLVESHVVLKKQKYIFEAEITLLGKNLRAFGDGRSKDNIFAAIDLAYGRVEKQLKRFREKVKDHHKKHVKQKGGRFLMPEEPGAAEYRIQGNHPAVIRFESPAVRQLSLEKASQMLEHSEENFLVFREAASRKPHIVFKRQDGNHGVIEI
jgi:putative sigma-54 modulation protein